MLNPNELFDETFYLSRNSDVAAAVSNGIFTSGSEHFFIFGKFEGREPSAFFDRDYYLESNLDVANAVSTTFTPFDHFMQFGQFEGRSPTPFFNSNWYRVKNPGVVAAVDRDELAGLFEHYLRFGAKEGRDPSAIYDNRYYLEENPEVAAAVERDEITGIEHFIEVGSKENFKPSYFFNSGIYLQNYPDVAEAVEAGVFDSAIDHFLRYGQKEGRSTTGFRWPYTGRFSVPGVIEPFGVDTISYQFADSSRDEIFTSDTTDKREIGLQIWYPTEQNPQVVPNANLPQFSRTYIPSDIFSLITESAQPQGLLPLYRSIGKPDYNELLGGFIFSDNEPDYPVIVFSHGLDSLPLSYTLEIENLVSQGYIVASVTHPYIAPIAELSNGQPVTLADNEFLNNPQPTEVALPQAANVMAADIGFAITQLEALNNNPNNLFYNRLDLSQVGVLGHELGGLSATQAMQQDSRIRAGASLDGLMLSPVVAQTPIDRPLMLLNAEETFNSSQSGLTLDAIQEGLRAQLYEQLDTGYNITVQGTKNRDFSDRPYLFRWVAFRSPDNFGTSKTFELGITDVGAIDGDRVIEITQDYTLAFFNRHLKNESEDLLLGGMSFPEVIFDSRLNSTSSP